MSSGTDTLLLQWGARTLFGAIGRGSVANGKVSFDGTVGFDLARLLETGLGPQGLGYRMAIILPSPRSHGLRATLKYQTAEGIDYLETGTFTGLPFTEPARAAVVIEPQFIHAQLITAPGGRELAPLFPELRRDAVDEQDFVISNYDGFVLSSAFDGTELFGAFALSTAAIKDTMLHVTGRMTFRRECPDPAA